MAKPPLDSFVGNTAKPSLDSFTQTPTVAPQVQPNPLGATFQSTGNESILGGIAKTVGNIPSSAVGFVKGTLNAINPVNIVKNASQIPSEFSHLVKEQGVGGVINAGKELLPTAYGALVPQAARQVISGDFQGARKTLQEDPVGQILPFILAGKTAAEKAGYGQQFDSAISKIASPVTDTASAVGGGIANATAGASRFLAGQATGLSPETIKQVVSNPNEFSKQAQISVTRPALAEEINKAIQDRQSALTDTGAEYGSIKTATTPVQVDPNYLNNLIKSKTGINVVDGELKTSGSASVRLPSDVNALQTKLYNVWQPEFAKGYLTPEQFLNFRSDLSKLAYNDSGIGKSTTLANLADQIRGQANTDLRPQIPGLNEIDAKFAPQITELNQLSQGLVDKNGHLSDSAINKIAGSLGKGKDPLLARLEQLSPGITDKVKILKAVEDIQNSREVKPGTYVRAGVLGSGIVSMNPYLIISSIASIPEIAVPLMRGLGYGASTISKTIKTLGINKIPGLVNQSPELLNKKIGK